MLGSLEIMKKDEQVKSEEMYKEYTNNANEEDINKIANNINKMKKGPIAKIWDQVSALWQMVKDPSAAWSSKAVAIGALIYLISPIDAIPDVIPVLGLTDDVGVITAAVASLSYALSKYMKKKDREEYVKSIEYNSEEEE